MLTILNLFGRSPFAPLASHMESVTHCVYLIRDLFKAVENEEFSEHESIVQKIREYEHQADMTKNDIRNHLPKSLFLAIDREELLKILTIQDSIADLAEDIAILTTFKKLQILSAFRDEFHEFLDKNIETFDGARMIIKELHELLESSFGGSEVEKVKGMVDDVAFKENQADLIQQKLLKNLIDAEDEISYTTFYLWQRIFEKVGGIANLAENLALSVRTTLELK